MEQIYDTPFWNFWWARPLNWAYSQWRMLKLSGRILANKWYVGRESHQYCGGRGFESCWSLRILSGLYLTVRITFTSILYLQCTHMLFITYTSCRSCNGYKLNSHLTCFRWGFIARLVEDRTGIAEVMRLNPVETSEFFLGFIRNCLSYFTTARITFTCKLPLHYEKSFLTLHFSFTWLHMFIQRKFSF